MGGLGGGMAAAAPVGKSSASLPPQGTLSRPVAATMLLCKPSLPAKSAVKSPAPQSSNSSVELPLLPCEGQRGAAEEEPSATPVQGASSSVATLLHKPLPSCLLSPAKVIVKSPTRQSSNSGIESPPLPWEGGGSSVAGHLASLQAADVLLTNKEHLITPCFTLLLANQEHQVANHCLFLQIMAAAALQGARPQRRRASCEVGSTKHTETTRRRAVPAHLPKRKRESSSNSATAIVRSVGAGSPRRQLWRFEADFGTSLPTTNTFSNQELILAHHDHVNNYIVGGAL